MVDGRRLLYCQTIPETEVRSKSVKYVLNLWQQMHGTAKESEV